MIKLEKLLNNYLMNLHSEYSKELDNVSEGNNYKIVELESKMELINKLCFDILTKKPQQWYESLDKKIYKK